MRTAGTHRPTPTRTIAATTASALGNDRLPSERREHSPQSFLELDLGLPAEELSRTGDVRLPHLRIVDGKRLVDDLALRAGDAKHPLRELVERELGRVADVHRQMLAGVGEESEPSDEIVDVAEAPGLGPVSEHGQGLAL